MHLFSLVVQFPLALSTLALIYLHQTSFVSIDALPPGPSHMSLALEEQAIFILSGSTCLGLFLFNVVVGLRDALERSPSSNLKGRKAGEGKEGMFERYAWVLMGLVGCWYWIGHLTTLAHLRSSSARPLLLLVASNIFFLFATTVVEAIIACSELSMTKEHCSSPSSLEKSFLPNEKAREALEGDDTSSSASAVAYEAVTLASSYVCILCSGVLTISLGPNPSTPSLLPSLLSLFLPSSTPFDSSSPSHAISSHRALLQTSILLLFFCHTSCSFTSSIQTGFVDPTHPPFIFHLLTRTLFAASTLAIALKFWSFYSLGAEISSLDGQIKLEEDEGDV